MFELKLTPLQINDLRTPLASTCSCEYSSLGAVVRELQIIPQSTKNLIDCDVRAA